MADRTALERRFQVMFARYEDRERIAARLVQMFIDDVTLYPLEWPVSGEPAFNDEWRFGSVVVRYRRYPSEQLIKILDISD